jgi:putative methionine-R-sulfoxide reductase with GAF domain
VPIDPAGFIATAASLREPDERDLARTLQQVVDTGKMLLGADGVGLMLADGNGQLRWASASDQWVQIVEEHHDRTGSGLCVAAFVGRTATSVRDVRKDPDSHGLRPVLTDARFVAALSIPLEVDGDAIGALDLYSATPRDWDDLERGRAQAYAALVTGLLAATVTAYVRGEQAAQLRTALDRRTTIEQAKGVLMAHNGIDATAAFEHLRTIARSSQRQVVDVAHDVIAGHPPPQLRSSLLGGRARRDLPNAEEA